MIGVWDTALVDWPYLERSDGTTANWAFITGHIMESEICGGVDFPARCTTDPPEEARGVGPGGTEYHSSGFDGNWCSVLYMKK